MSGACREGEESVSMGTRGTQVFAVSCVLLLAQLGRAASPSKPVKFSEIDPTSSLACDVTIVDGSLGWLCGAPRNAGISLASPAEVVEVRGCMKSPISACLLLRTDISENVYVQVGSGERRPQSSGSPHVDGMMYRSVGSVGSFWEHRSSEGLVAFSMSSLWIVGLSGSLFERFYNGESWVREHQSTCSFVQYEAAKADSRPGSCSS